MIATLERRLARLEDRFPPDPPDPPEDGGDEAFNRWWDNLMAHAPPPVLDYVVALGEELAADPDADLDAAHPALADVIHAVACYADKGEDCPLDAVHHAVLSRAFLRLQAYHARHGYGGYHRGTSDAAWRDFCGWVGPTAREVQQMYNVPVRWVDLWRASGTTDPRIRALMGLHAAEADLLAAG